MKKILVLFCISISMNLAYSQDKEKDKLIADINYLFENGEDMMV